MINITFKVNFPEFCDENYVQICFIRKYRQKMKSHYVFYNVEINKEISSILKEWLKNNISLCDGVSVSPYNPTNDSDDFEYYNFEYLKKWEAFKEKAFTIQNEKVHLSKLKKNLVGYIIYTKTSEPSHSKDVSDNNQDEFIIGQIRKLSPSNVLDKKGFYRLFFDNSKFNDLKEDTGLKIDKKADLVFKISKKCSEAIILEKNNFKSIFDMHEEEKKKATDILEKISIIKNSQHFEQIMQITSDDRTIQRMLINPIVEDYLNEIGFEIIQELKEELKEKIDFDIDQQNQQIILITGKEKDGLRDLIKTVTNRYNRSLNNKHILESDPKRFLK